jgi:hypothetical protein
MMPPETVTLKLTPRQAEALRALAALEELPPEVYAAEVLVKHLYHAYTPEVQRRAQERAAAPGPSHP